MRELKMKPENIAQMVVNSREKGYAMIIPADSTYILAKALLAAEAQLAELAEQKAAAVVRQTTAGRHCTMFAVFPVGTLFYTRATSPAPVKLPDCVDDLHGIGPVMSADAVVEAIKAAGGSVADE